MATKAIEDKKHEMEATMVNLGDKVGSNIQQVAGDMMGAASVRRLDGEDGDQESPLPSSSFQVRSQESGGDHIAHWCPGHAPRGGEEQLVHPAERQDDRQLLQEDLPHGLHPLRPLLLHQVLT